MMIKKSGIKIAIICILLALAYIVYFAHSPFPRDSNYLICLTGDIDGPSLSEPAKERIKNLFEVFQENDVNAYTVFITTRTTPVSRSSDLTELSSTLNFLQLEAKKRNIRLEIGSHSSFHYYIGEDYTKNFVYETMKQSIDDLKSVGIDVKGYRPPNYLWRDDLPRIARDLGFRYVTSIQEGEEIRHSLTQVVQDYQSSVILDLPYLPVYGKELDDYFLLDVFKYDDETAGKKMYERVKELSYPASTITIQTHPDRTSLHIEFIKYFLNYLNKDNERKKYLFVTCSEAVELQRSLKARLYAKRKALLLSQNINSLATTFYNKGVESFDKGEYEEAVKYFDLALKEDPSLSLAWINRGATLSALNREEEALKSYEKGLEIDPNDDLAWLNKGISLTKLGRYDEALKSYEKALEINPKNEKALEYKNIVQKHIKKTL